MKTVQWRSERRRLEVLVGAKECKNCFETFIEKAKNRPVTIMLKDNSQLRGVLLEGSFGALVAVQIRNPKPSLILIRCSEIRCIAFAKKET